MLKSVAYEPRMEVVDNYRLTIGERQYVPIVIGGMGVDISTAELALEACRLGGIGNISDAMSPFVSDRKFNTSFSKKKSEQSSPPENGKAANCRFDLEDLLSAQRTHVQSVMEKKQGDGAIWVNVMEKLTMGDPLGTLRARLIGALDAGADGITLSAGLHNHSMRLMSEHPRFRDAELGIIVSSARALRIFLRSASRVNRLPDFVVVEGPLAGGHLGFGPDWEKYELTKLVGEVLAFLRKEDLHIPVIPAGGIFTGGDAVNFLRQGASGIQVATRFTVSKECGLPAKVKQRYFEADESDVVVTCASPTGYLLRMLATSPCLHSPKKRPACPSFGYVLDKEGKCPYIDEFDAIKNNPAAAKATPAFDGKICLCMHFSKHNCWTCGHYVYRLKDTTIRNADGTYQLPSAAHIFHDYQYSAEHAISLPESEDEQTSVERLQVNQERHP